MDILFKNADIITMRDDSPVIRNGFVGVSGDTICYVGETMPDEKAARIIDCSKKILMPGLVNTHTHTAMCIMRGYADDYTLCEWLYDKIFPVEARLDERAILAGTALGVAEMLRTGTTSINDMYFRQPSVAKQLINVGMRASLSNGIVAIGEGSFDPQKDRAVSETRILAEEYNGAGNGRIKAEVSIHGEYTSYPQVWRYAVNMAEKYNLGIHIHLSETKKEHDDCITRRGMTPARALYENGVFSHRTLAAHCVWLSDDDMTLLAENNVSCAHNPVSNLKLASGIADVSSMQKHGMNVSLGTDGCCSNNTHDLFEEIKLSALLSKAKTGDPTSITAYDALKMATANGAKAQGRNDIGVIAVGMKADVILIDTDNPVMQPMYDPCSSVAYSASGRDVYLTMVDGKVLYENGEFTTIDIEKAKAQVNSYAVPLVLNKTKE